MDWLDDSDVNYFLKVFAETTEDSFMVGGTGDIPSTISTLVCSSFYFESLRIRGMACISQWLDRFDLERVKKILFPLYSDSHWSICLIDRQTGISVIFDPLRPIHKFLSQILLSHDSVNIVIYSTHCTQQDNSYDCGVYSLYYAGCIIKKKYDRINQPVPEKFKQYIRKRMKRRRDRK